MINIRIISVIIKAAPNVICHRQVTTIGYFHRRFSWFTLNVDNKPRVQQQRPSKRIHHRLCNSIRDQIVEYQLRIDDTQCVSAPINDHELNTESGNSVQPLYLSIK
jgi:hypothetical protein